MFGAELLLCFLVILCLYFVDTLLCVFCSSWISAGKERATVGEWNSWSVFEVAGNISESADTAGAWSTAQDLRFVSYTPLTFQFHSHCVTVSAVAELVFFNTQGVCVAYAFWTMVIIFNDGDIVIWLNGCCASFSVTLLAHYWHVRNYFTVDVIVLY